MGVAYRWGGLLIDGVAYRWGIRLISRLNNPTTHTCWREIEPRHYSQIKFADSVTKTELEQIESNPNFRCWEQVPLELSQYVTKPIYDPKKYTYVTKSSSL